GQISGVSADLAWKLSIGDQRVGVTICDTGIRWDREELRRRIRLNPGELPVPCGVTAGQKGRPLAEYDCDGDGMFTPDDYAGIVAPNEGPHGNPAKLDGEDVLVHFSDGVDDDGNGFVDDIAGWDFFDDDNNPFDASSYSSAGNHGSGRASDALAEGNNGLSGIGLCPQCRLVPVRIWDTFVPDPNNFALCMLYAADNGIQVVEAAIGAVTTTEFAQTATQYAYEHGVALMEVSSDLNTADHNSPTNFNNTIFVKGTVADAEGASMDVNRPPFPQVALTSPVGTWFRDSNLTQARKSDGVNDSLIVPIVGTASFDRGATTSLSYTLEFGIGIEPTTFTTFASGSSPSRIGFDTSTSPPHRPGAVLGTLNLAD